MIKNGHIIAHPSEEKWTEKDTVICSRTFTSEMVGLNLLTSTLYSGPPLVLLSLFRLESMLRNVKVRLLSQIDKAPRYYTRALFHTNLTQWHLERAELYLTFSWVWGWFDISYKRNTCFWWKDVLLGCDLDRKTKKLSLWIYEIFFSSWTYYCNVSKIFNGSAHHVCIIFIEWSFRYTQLIFFNPIYTGCPK